LLPQEALEGETSLNLADEVVNTVLAKQLNDGNPEDDGTIL